ncbi:GGDEF domain-containing protein [Phreatobacter sp.]|uniref:GGDEF domain-containing protein n=1 Tax=Phreatobacter sp. TaxID=1966341 RepID=UPI003F730C3A
MALPLLGREFDGVALVMCVACPLLIAFPVSVYQFGQRQRLKQAKQAMERIHIELDHAHKALAQAHGLLAERARRDGMTGVLNREGFFQSIRDTRMPATGGTLLVIDVDHFKSINDSFGHQTGDEALKMIAAAVAGCIRNGDLIGRIGGEEFAVFLTGADEGEATIIAERIRAAVARLSLAAEGGERRGLTVSIGGAAGQHGSPLAELMRQADRRLYEAKRHGRNRVVMGRFWPEAA